MVAAMVAAAVATMVAAIVAILRLPLLNEETSVNIEGRAEHSEHSEPTKSMYDLVRCMACGYPLGDVADIFKAMRADKIKRLQSSEQKESRALIVHSGASAEFECGDILDALEIMSECCRNNMFTIQRFEDFY